MNVPATALPINAVKSPRRWDNHAGVTIHHSGCGLLSFCGGRGVEGYGVTRDQQGTALAWLCWKSPHQVRLATFWNRFALVRVCSKRGFHDRLALPSTVSAWQMARQTLGAELALIRASQPSPARSVQCGAKTEVRSGEILSAEDVSQLPDARGHNFAVLNSIRGALFSVFVCPDE